MRSRKSQQGPPVVYDPDAHREFVTGFRRRKQARRATAAARALESERETRRQERRVKREVFRRNLDQDDDDVGSEAEEEGVQQISYEGEGDVLVTASVTPLEKSFGNMGVATRTKGEGEGDLKKSRGGNEGKTVEGEARTDGGGKAEGGIAASVRGVAASRIAKVRKPGRRRKVSYTHLMSKGNKRKAQLRRRKAK